MFPESKIICMLIWVLSIQHSCNAKILKTEEGPLVETNSGTVIGKVMNVLDNSVAIFEGIPFAEPPLGEKRFEKPVPIHKWNTPYYAQKKSNSCMQYSTRKFIWIPAGLTYSEDCLYLNVWVPLKNDNTDIAEKLPVMVWIFGGGYAVGSASMDVYDGKILAALGNVIVVNLNYRSGVFGFLNGGIKEAPGNVALHDQLLGVKWIKENIQFFGGDPESITLFGESSGASSVGFLITSPLTTGLFQKVIMQSGTPYLVVLNEEASNSLLRANKFAIKAGCADNHSNITNQPLEVIKCLKSKDGLELAKVEEKFISIYPAYFQAFFGNTCEGCNDILPISPSKYSKSGKLKQIPALVGNTENEGAIFLSYLMPDVFIFNEKPTFNLSRAKSAIEYLFSFIPGISPQKVFEYYFSQITENNDDIIKTISNAVGDYMFYCPSLFFGEDSQNAHMYWMSHESTHTNDSSWVGMTHIYDVPYVFGLPILNSQNRNEDVVFSEYAIKLWSTFARHGHPFGETGTQEWPPFSPDLATTYKLDNKDQGLINFPRKEACEFWRPYFLHNDNQLRIYI